MILLSSVAIFFGHGMPSNALNLALQTAASVQTFTPACPETVAMTNLSGVTTINGLARDNS